MRAGSDVRGNRSVRGTGAVLVVLLAALVHLLGCAHGPTPGPAPRADALAAAPAAPGGLLPPEPPRAEAAGHGAPASGTWSPCGDADQPTVRGPREPEPAGAGLSAAPAAGAPAVLSPAAPGQPSGPARAAAPDAGRTRAGLGVWRT
ncbi:hypothetical protein [Streptomyces sp. TP-A0875]|uniref:hypothetical protein n=1 Tax=Streptomyces sp. TP-A0875 TaxID=552354 RepID=UPI00131D7D6B|nr:hypothetical protein [Streptomyces sp. TP-A0875]